MNVEVSPEPGATGRGGEHCSDARGGARIGVLVPFTNVNLEPDLALLCPPTCTLHVARLGGYAAERTPGAEQMAGLGASDMGEALRLIAGVRPHAVLYGCTSATLVHGPGFDRELGARIRALCDAPALTAAGALLVALEALGARRVGFCSPYLGEINERAVRFLAEAGVGVVRRTDIGRELGNYAQGELAPEEVYELGLRADHPEAEAIVLSCTDMRAVETIERLESALGKPVVTSNQALVFALLGQLDLPHRADLPGRLFECRAASAPTLTPSERSIDRESQPSGRPLSARGERR